MHLDASFHLKVQSRSNSTHFLETRALKARTEQLVPATVIVLVAPLQDFETGGREILASRLGYRITEDFVIRFFGRVFADPTAVLTGEQLRPEEQGVEDYVAGIEHIVEGQQKAAATYFKDGGVDLAVPPLAAVIGFMTFIASMITRVSPSLTWLPTEMNGLAPGSGQR